MGRPEPYYRHEYLTGWAAIYDGFALSVTVAVLNHGDTDEYARAIAYGSNGDVQFDTGYPAPIPPDGYWSHTADLFQSGGTVGAFRLRVLTTSSSLLPSAGDPNRGLISIDTQGHPYPFPDYGPNDFVHIIRPPQRPIPIPPVGPVEGA